MHSQQRMNKTKISYITILNVHLNKNCTICTTEQRQTKTSQARLQPGGGRFPKEN